MTDYAAVLTANYSDDEWTLTGNDYNALEWRSDTPKPTQAELDAAWPAVQQSRIDAQVAKQATKQSAIEKLAALGLTVDEIKEAFGLEAPQ